VDARRPFADVIAEKEAGMKDKPDLTDALWRRSSRSDDVAACVEVAVLDNGFAVRDSRHPEGPALFFTPAEWEAFVGGARDGEFDV
jgi:hypothetical protein